MEFVKDYQLNVFRKVSTSQNQEKLKTPNQYNQSPKSAINERQKAQIFQSAPTNYFTLKLQSSDFLGKSYTLQDSQKVQNAKDLKRKIDYDKLIESTISYEQSRNVQKRIKDRCTRLITRPTTASNTSKSQRQNVFKHLERKFDKIMRGSLADKNFSKQGQTYDISSPVRQKSVQNLQYIQPKTTNNNIFQSSKQIQTSENKKYVPILTASSNLK